MLNHEEMFRALLNKETVIHTDEIGEIREITLIGGKLHVRHVDGKHTVPLTNYVLIAKPNALSLKPKTININGFEVPEPVREPLNEGNRYYMADTTSLMNTEFVWDNDETDYNALEAGIIHLTKEAAELHAKALLSFTRKKDE